MHGESIISSRRMIQDLHEASFLLPEVVLHTGQTDTQPRITKTEEMQLRHNADCIKSSSCQRMLMSAWLCETRITAYFLLFIKIFSYRSLCFVCVMWEALCRQIAKWLIGFGRYPRKGIALILKVHTSCSNIFIYPLGL